jgi:hypothetical protein
LHIDLHKRAGQFFFFPRRRRLARAQAHDHVFPAHRLAGMERDVLDDPIALVEQAEDRDPLAHGGHPRLIDARRSRRVGDHRARRILLVSAAPAGRNGERKHGERGSLAAHVYSGIQGS